MRNLLAAPISFREEILGALYLTEKPGVFTEDDERILTTLCSDAAVAMENARLFGEADRRRRVAEALAAVERDLIQSLDPSLVAQVITDNVRHLLGLPSSGVYRLVESGDLVPVALSGSGGSALGRDLILPRSEGAVGLAIREQRPVASEDVLTDPRITFSPDVRARIERAGFRAVLAVPLVVQGRVIGALTVGGPAGRVFQVEEIRLAGAFADQAALALENARLFETTRSALADLKAAQEQLVQGATMRALGELAAGTAHHLNNLLAIVLGRVHLLLQTGGASPLRRALEIIERATRDAAEVVRRVARLARGQPLHERQPLDLRALATEVIELTRTRWQDQARARGIHIEAGLEGEDLPAPVGDAAALREVLLNLVLNAVEALPRGGRIILRTFREDGWVCLAVSDTGVGMPPEVKERALEPFFTTKGPKGMGLGLSLAYGILDRHGGALSIESTEGRGTTVTLRLPIRSGLEAEAPRAESQPARPSTSALRILVIDDDPEVREVLAEMLGVSGHEVLRAGAGREGLALLEAGERIDLVLTDLGMPDMNGWEVARAIKARWPGLPVGILTGWEDEIDETSPDSGAVAGMLRKPVDSGDLEQLIAACLGTG